MTRRRRPARRGSAYLLVLGTSMLVTIIGIAAIARARVHHRVAATGYDAIEARLGAQSAVDLTLRKMASITDWRGSIPHDQWIVEGTVNGIELSYKVVDEDGDLEDDPEDAVRVYGRARVGAATRIYSALIDVDITGGTGTNVADLQVLLVGRAVGL